MKSHENHQNHDAAERNLLFHALEFEIFPLPPYKVEGERGGAANRGGREVCGRRKRRGGKREKKGKIMHHCAIFRKRKIAKRREPTNTGRNGD